MLSRMETHMAMAVMYMRPHKAIKGYKRPYKAKTAIHYHNVPQKIQFCSHCNWDFVNLILTYRKFFVGTNSMQQEKKSFFQFRYFQVFARGQTHICMCAYNIMAINHKTIIPRYKSLFAGKKY